MPRITCNGRTIDLGTADFVAQGGQASVYGRDAWAYKLYTDIAQVPDPSKLAALKRLARPGVVAPDTAVYDWKTNARVGFRMPLLDGWNPLVRLFPPAYKQRVGLDPAVLGERVLELRELVDHAHAHHALVVDLNELNVLVAPDHGALALIDVDSWQTPGFPATALAESVRDRHTRGFSEQTDWFAYAVVTFQLFAGIHPFRGRHPTVKSLDDRMLQNLSVFHPDVVVPPMADLDALPDTWRDWYEALFVYGERIAPPATFTAAVRRVRSLPGASVDVGEAFALPGPILGTASWDGRTWAWTADGLYEGRRRLGPAPPRGWCAFRAPAGIAFAGLGEGNRNHARIAIQLADGTRLDTALHAAELSAHRGMLHGRTGNALIELTLRRFAGEAQLTSRVATHVAPHATRLFRGVAITTVLGSVLVHRLGEGTCEQQRIEALDGHQVVDAIHTAGVTVLVSKGPAGATAPSGWTRHILAPDGLISEPTAIPAAELLVLPTGVALTPTESGLELFLAERPGRGRRTVDVDLPAVLVDIGGKPGFLRDDTVHTLTLRR